MFFAYYFLLYFTNIYNGVWEENTFCFIFWGFVMDGSDTVGGKLFLIYCVNSMEKFRNFISRVVFVECPCFSLRQRQKRSDKTDLAQILHKISIFWNSKGQRLSVFSIVPRFTVAGKSVVFALLSFHFIPLNHASEKKMLHGNFIPRWTFRVYKKNI